MNARKHDRSLSKPSPRRVQGTTPRASPPLRRTSREVRALPSISPVEAVQEVNLRCIELLTHAARQSTPEVVELARELRDVLRQLTQEMRARAARRPFLLVDMHFANPDWWRRVKTYPARVEPIAEGRGSFSRPAAIQLARTVLTLAWHCVRADRHAAYVLLGLHFVVSELIAKMSIDDISRIAERHFRDARPRWEDRPEMWRKLLLASKTPNVRRARDVNVRGLQWIAGTLIVPGANPIGIPKGARSNGAYSG